MSNLYLTRLRSLPRPEVMEHQYALVSLFSGAGGLDLGFAFAGFRTRFASDIEPVHCDTMAKNFPGCVTLPENVKLVTGKQIKERAKLAEIDLVAGGPPCQAFSILGQRNSFEDPRGRLVYEFVRLVTELNPHAFVFENVPGLLTLNGGRDWELLLRYLEAETGYKLFHHVPNAADFGIPQIRRRLFVVGFRSTTAEFEFPAPTHRDPDAQPGLLDYKLPSWLPARLAVEEVDGLPNHRIRPHGTRVTERYRKLRPGSRDRIDHTDRINPERPSGTVLVGSKAGGGRPHIHPTEARHITVREAARLQSFPDWYVLSGTDTWQYRGIGNAVPPLLAKAIGEQISLTMKQLREKFVPA